MTFLPIVERELRVAARKRFTYWSRIVAAALGLVIFVLLQLLLQTAGAGSRGGQVEFGILRWMAFIFAAGAGLFLTSDSLSEEIREGTLGLLFLTDLRGYDVVLGKFSTQLLRAFYGLLAVFPIMGIALLVGGVTGGEFWRSILVICNTLFLSLSLGMFVSSISRDATRAMNGTLLLGILIIVVAPALDAALVDVTKHRKIFSLIDPVYLFGQVGGYRASGYWLCLLIQNALAWFLLVLASLRAPRAWQEKSFRTSASRPGLANRWRFGGPRLRLALRRRLLAIDPLLWLALRDRWLPRMIWTFTVIFMLLESAALVFQYQQIPVNAAAIAAMTAASTNSAPSGGTVTTTNGITTYSYSVTTRTVIARGAIIAAAGTVGWLFRIGMALWIASQAARFFVEAARNGAMELLLVAPLNAAQVIRAQWLGLCRTYWFPVVCIALLHLAGGVISAMEIRAQSTGMAARGVSWYSGQDMTLYMFAKAALEAFTTIAAFAAIAWYGMWMGLINRKTSIAVMKTMCFVIVLPYIALAFVRMFSMIGALAVGMAGYPGLMMLVPIVIMSVLALGKDWFFIWLARLNFRVHFREELTRDRSFAQRPPPQIRRPPARPPPPPPPMTAPPPLPPPIPAN